MKIVVSIVVALVCGGVLGFYLGFSEISADIDEVATLATDEGQSTMPSGISETAVGGYPRVKLPEGEDFDFGVMEKDETRKHAFIFENVGDSPLKLTKGETTCKCTLSDLINDTIAPGESAEVLLEWTPKSFARDFRQSATIITNDPARQSVRLVVYGRVIQTVRPAPEELLFKNVSLNEARSASLRVYCYRDGHFNLTSAGFQDEQTAKHFDVEIQPLTEDQLASEPDAKSGHQVTVTLQPGMRLGPIEQTLKLVSTETDLPDFDIPIRGSVTGDITLVPGMTPYVSEQKLLRLGAVNRKQGATFKMHLLVKGPYAQDVQLKVGQVEPADVLNVTIDTDNPRSLKDGAVLMYPMTVNIPVGSRAVNRLGGRGSVGSAKLGRITIETTHPQTKELLLHVQFATEG